MNEDIDTVCMVSTIECELREVRDWVVYTITGIPGDQRRRAEQRS